jgi:hypothetical protein
MPKLLPATEALRIDQALQVYALLEEHPKMSQTTACKKVGIDVQLYRRWISLAYETLELFRQARSGVRRLELEKILLARESILVRLIKDGTSPFTRAEDRLEIYKYLVEQTDRLMDEVHIQGDNEADFLKGPKLKPVESTFSPSEVTITIKSKQPTIIDMTSKEED